MSATPARVRTIPISCERATRSLRTRRANTTVTMGCGDACPVIPGKRYVDWDLQDPAGQDMETVRTIRDEIARRVEELPL